MPNRLAGESSPYLQQHAGNPVDWYPWGEDAFAKARADDKPIFLSIGYSTCHWCHVMEHESFEDEGIARVLNDHFVAIKVDREERPDVDRIYMLFVQATTGSGGWPMSVWLTPSLRPFFGGTYFPPASRWGRPGFSEVLQEIARLWGEDRSRLERSAEDVVAQLREIATAKRGAAGATAPGPDALTRAVDAFRGAFDSRHGGFGGAPKFPRPSELLFLLREAHRTGDESIREMVEATLRAMSLGGMRDHVGGGFHRYSVDAEWRVPHFEKMLYDQAQIGLALVETTQATGDAFWAAVAEDTFAYVRREMTDPEGGFYSAEDADSLPPESAGRPGAQKSEGAFYLWGTEEARELLGEADATVVAERFGMRPGGNAPHDPQGEFGTKNILYTARDLDDVAATTSRSVDDVVDALGRARQRMFAHRASRPRPHLDDKVLVSWNGLMVAALARAARTLAPHVGDDAAEQSLAAALRAATFVRTRLWDAASGQLTRRYRKGDAAVPAYADDYASMAWGALELFQTTGDAPWLEWAVALQRAQDARFWDDDDHAWFDATDADRSLLFRMKEDYDGAEPAASSVSARNVLTLAHLVGGDEWPRRVELVLARYAALARQQPRAIPFMMAVLSAWHGGSTQIVVVGPREREDTRALHRVVAGANQPFAIVIPVEPGRPQEAMAALLPLVGAMRTIGGAAAAYVCRDFTCDAPVTAPAELSERLHQRQAFARTESGSRADRDRQ